MARSRYEIFEVEFSYFITCTVINWLPLLKTKFAKQTIIDSMKYLQKEKGLKIFAYTIMHNHVHIIISSENPVKYIANFKSYTARRIIDYYKRNNDTSVLNEMASAKPKYKIGCQYKFWQEGYCPKQITSLDIFQQKIDYIHFNPVRKGSVESAKDWKWSSASKDGPIMLDKIT